MSLTRFKDRDGFDGPVSGTIILIPVTWAQCGTNTYAWTYVPPAGMSLQIVAAHVRAVAVANSPVIQIGNTLAGTQLLASTTVTTNLGNVTLKAAGLATKITSSNLIDVKMINPATATADGVSVTLTAYVSSPPTSLEYR